MSLKPASRTPRATRLGVRCPHCDSRCVGQRDRRISRVLTEVDYLCTNPQCNHRFVVAVEAVRTIGLSSTPRADVHLPLSSHIRRSVIAAQISQLPPARCDDAWPAGQAAAVDATGDLFEATG